MYAYVWFLTLAILAIGLYFYFKVSRQRHLGIDRKLKVFIQALNDCAFYQQAVIKKSFVDEFCMSDVNNRERIKLKVIKDKLVCSWEYDDGKKILQKELKFPYKNDYSESIQINMVEEVLIQKIFLLEARVNY